MILHTITTNNKNGKFLPMVFVFDLFDLKIKTLFWEINFQHNQRLDGNFKHFIRIRPESFCPSIWMVHGIGYVGLLNRNSPVHMYLVSHPHSDSPSNKEQRTTIIIIIVMDHQTRDDGEAFLESRHAKLYSNYYGSHRHKEEGRWVDRDEIVFVSPFPTGIAINNLWSLLPAQDVLVSLALLVPTQRSPLCTTSSFIEFVVSTIQQWVA